jgi:hypothetical protein
MCKSKKKLPQRHNEHKGFLVANGRVRDPDWDDFNIEKGYLQKGHLINRQAISFNHQCEEK